MNFILKKHLFHKFCLAEEKSEERLLYIMKHFGSMESFLDFRNLAQDATNRPIIMTCTLMRVRTFQGEIFEDL